MSRHHSLTLSLNLSLSLFLSLSLLPLSLSLSSLSLLPLSLSLHYLVWESLDCVSDVRVSSSDHNDDSKLHTSTHLL